MQLTFIIDSVENKFCYMLTMIIISVAKINFTLCFASASDTRYGKMSSLGFNTVFCG